MNSAEIHGMSGYTMHSIVSVSALKDDMSNKKRLILSINWKKDEKEQTGNDTRTNMDISSCIYVCTFELNNKPKNEKSQL